MCNEYRKEQKTVTDIFKTNKKVINMWTCEVKNYKFTCFSPHKAPVYPGVCEGSVRTPWRGSKAKTVKSDGFWLILI